MLGLMLLLLWFLVLWIMFRAGWLAIDEFGAYAMFGTAVGTTAMALATVYMAMQNRELVKQNRIMVWRPYYVELIVSVLDPLLESTKSLVAIHRNKSYSWGFELEEQLDGQLTKEVDVLLFKIGGSPQFYLPTHFSLRRLAAGLNERRYSDLLQGDDRLKNSIDQYEKQVIELARLLLGLAEKLLSGELKLKEAVEKYVPLGIQKGEAGYEEELQKNTLYCVEELFKAFLGRRQPYGRPLIRDFLEKNSYSLMQEIYADEGMLNERAQVCKLADSLAGPLEDIDTQLEGIASKYRHDYGITEEMIAMAREASR